MTRPLLVALFAAPLVLVAACGPKAPVTPVVEAPAPEPAPAPPPPEPEPVVDVEAPLPNNIDLMLTLKRADSSTFSGRLVRLDRGVDWYADRGWTGEPADLKLAVLLGGGEVEKAWSELAKIDIAYGGADDLDCSLDGDHTPPMHLCTLRANSTAKTVDGKTGSVETRHRWRLRFEDGTEVELHFGRVPARSQPESGDEDPALYGSLQQELLAGRTKGITSILIGK